VETNGRRWRIDEGRKKGRRDVEEEKNGKR
jgi:hypothetical protein